MPGGTVRFLREDMPLTVQVGLVVNPGGRPNDGEGQFRSIRFRRISDFSPCLADG
jgi:hypothetical protein